jgi:hypothetical protein
MPETSTADYFPVFRVIFALRFTKTTAPKRERRTLRTNDELRTVEESYCWLEIPIVSLKT